MKKKTMAVILISLSLVMIILLSVLITVIIKYNSVDFNEITSFDETYSYRGNVLYSSNLSHALVFQPYGGFFKKYEPITLNMSDFGLEGSFSYNLIDDLIVPVDEKYANLYNANTATTFVYISADNKKYLVSLIDKAATPLFKGSIKGVDAYATDVVALSTSGEYAASLNGSILTLYRREYTNSFKISEVKTIDLSKKLKGQIKLISFINKKILYFKAENGYFLCDSESQDITDCYLDKISKYKNDAISKYFIEKKPTKKESSDKENIILHYAYLLSGEEYDIKLARSEYTSAKIDEISPDGSYSLLSAIDTKGNKQLIVYKSDGKKAVLTGYNKNILEAQNMFFIYKNILFVDFGDTAKSYKICF